MKLTFSVDTDEMYGEDGVNFEHLLADSLKREIIKNAKTEVASEKFEEFSGLVSDTIVADVKLRMQGFLSEEIVLTEEWGKPKFVGSIEDLIKKRFDDVLLRPVDNNGRTLQGCTSSGRTWIEWSIEQKMEKSLREHLDTAGRNIQKWVEKHVSDKHGQTVCDYGGGRSNRNLVGTG